MEIDQRNAGASVTNAAAVDTYTLDRYAIYGTSASKFTCQQNAGSVTPPVGFKNYMGFTSLSNNSPAATDEYIFFQKIEGFNTADLDFGTANAKTITLSAWVRSSLTGTFSGALQNSANNRFYPFSYSIPVANTWTNISVTIAGDTSGTWIGATNGTGINVKFNLGTGSTYLGTAGAWTSSFANGTTGSVNVLGTNGATFYITGVDLRLGEYAAAPSSDFRSYGQELALCQRYFEKSYAQGTVAGTATAIGSLVFSTAYTTIANTAGFGISPRFVVTKRAAPTVNIWSRQGTATALSTNVSLSTSLAANSGVAVDQSDTNFALLNNSGSGVTLVDTFTGFHFTASAEL